MESGAKPEDVKRIHSQHARILKEVSQFYFSNQCLMGSCQVQFTYIFLKFLHPKNLNMKININYNSIFKLFSKTPNTPPTMI